ncbi:hypothetical protein SAMN05661093_08624 [Kibdelosporangium aridum]|uniref:Uncharacterized protein n=1 Tax=Kibdelosporangium aridum TaxID=2030 RepID=A0A1W2FRD3_KIBAR|nr:hypothetical protein SAMN05661093_08624 [Kibdelosporangium aridum]
MANTDHPAGRHPVGRTAGSLLSHWAEWPIDALGGYQLYRNVYM